MIEPLKAFGRLLAGLGAAGLLLALFLDPLLAVVGLWLGVAGLALWGGAAAWQRARRSRE